MEELEVTSHRLFGMSFGTFNSDELLKLSVKEIVNPQTFDMLLHPTHGGLYDPALGPNDRDDVCGTCGQNNITCPGHMAHIQLPLPVYNPVFFPTMIQILKGSCAFCHKLRLSPTSALLIKHQLHLLDYGLVSHVDDLTELYNNIIVDGKGDQNMVTILQDQLEKLVADTLNDINKKDASTHVFVKNVVEYRQLLIKDFIKKNFASQSGKCRHCGLRVQPLRSEHNSKVFYQSVSDRKAAADFLKNKQKEKEKKKTDTNKENDQEYVVIEEPPVPQKVTQSKTGQTYVTPLEAKAHLRQLWEIDGTILRLLFGVLNLKCSNPSVLLTSFFWRLCQLCRQGLDLFLL